MTIPPPGEAVPDNRSQALALIRAVDGDFSRLTDEQIAAIRQLYRLDDGRPIAEAMR